MIGVTHGEGIGESIVKRNLRSRVVSHRGGGFGRHPTIPASVVPGFVPSGPAVIEILDALVC